MHKLESTVQDGCGGLVREFTNRNECRKDKSLSWPEYIVKGERKQERNRKLPGEKSGPRVKNWNPCKSVRST